MNRVWAVVFRPQAESDALEVRRWYDGRRVGLGRDFAAELDRAVERIAGGPIAFPRAHQKVRRAVLPHRFPYAIYFRVADDTVVVLAVHGRQHPVRWRRRA